MKKGLTRITKKEFYADGAFSNPSLCRIMRGKVWKYYRINNNL